MGPNQDLLSLTAFFSVLLHAVIILGVSFKLPDIANIQNTDNALDVVLINAPNQRKPDDAELVSTNDSQGGGEDDRSASSPIPYETVSPSPIASIKRTASQQPISALTPDRLITAKKGQVTILSEQPDQLTLEAKQDTKGPDLITTKSQRQLERERLIAKLSQDWEDYQKRPNKEYLSPSTKQHHAAKYLDDWRKKIEIVGNANYPSQARANGLSGTLILTVEINRNGTINDVGVINPSPHKLLNDAAVRFVRDASPFPPFPDEIDKDTDILVITRAFHFLRNNRLSSSDASSAKSR